MLNPSNLTGIVLAGGKSTRMGKDKAFLMLDDKPFISHILETVKQCAENVLIISNNQKLDSLGVTRHADLIPCVGPIGGIYTGLTHSNTEFNIVVACDTPLLNKETIGILIDGIDDKHDGFIVQHEDVPMPLVGIYRKSSIAYFKEAIDEEKLGLQKLLATLRTKTIDLPKSHSKSVWNINTLEDFRTIKKNRKET
ncbi:molybdenum cofactor guanylyltransferase [Flagellimonas halotolerans]|uniref:Probable molybdenum cofactor guanylyltransferase n=1 Tax=Flagellimonas halotolerans TaxID=3112164 RepID=A0ABU6IT21_9FLAO|nr:MULTISPECIES: molybdenum cofactor guanylyltransferase [unclassified Allomuricauda]MEC3966402.1 molybdenum cofactor guanylyltransferase [Muricauda sp. SYSU M86414]MEC4266267.1 molybdenum cofactor guanylyltransferase [Muricauda sp. SYSU M84420]